GLGDLRLDVHVFVAKQLHIDAPFFGEHFKALSRQLGSKRGLEESLLKLKENRLDFGLDVLDEVHVGRFDLLVIGVAAFVDVLAAATSIYNRRKLGEICQPSV